MRDFFFIFYDWGMFKEKKKKIMLRERKNMKKEKMVVLLLLKGDDKVFLFLVRISLRFRLFVVRGCAR